jgi:protein-tyrosine phosphatase
MLIAFKLVVGLVIVHDDCTKGLIKKAEPAWDFIDEHKDKGSILVHCFMGASRSPATLASYLIARKKMSAEGAVNLICDKRPQAMNMAHTFEQELIELEKEWH